MLHPPEPEEETAEAKAFHLERLRQSRDHLAEVLGGGDFVGLQET